MDLSEFDDHRGFMATFTVTNKREEELFARLGRLLGVIEAMNKVKRSSRDAFYYHSNFVPTTKEETIEADFGLYTWERLLEVQGFELQLGKTIDQMKARNRSQVIELNKIRAEYEKLLVNTDAVLEHVLDNDGPLPTTTTTGDIVIGGEEEEQPPPPQSYDGVQVDSDPSLEPPEEVHHQIPIDPPDISLTWHELKEIYSPETEREATFFAHVYAAYQQLLHYPVKYNVFAGHEHDILTNDVPLNVLVLRQYRARILEDINSVHGSVKELLAVIRRLDVEAWLNQYRMDNFIQAFASLEKRIGARSMLEETSPFDEDTNDAGSPLDEPDTTKKSEPDEEEEEEETAPTKEESPSSLIHGREAIRHFLDVGYAHIANSTAEEESKGS